MKEHSISQQNRTKGYGWQISEMSVELGRQNRPIRMLLQKISNGMNCIEHNL